MYREEKEALNSVTYTYYVSTISKRDMLDHIVTILEDDDIKSHGIIVTEPTPDEEWSGLPLEMPELPVREVFLDKYEKINFSGITAIMEYHGMPIMLSYRPIDKTISIIIPKETRASIDEIEKNVIPDAIDDNPAVPGQTN